MINKDVRKYVARSGTTQRIVLLFFNDDFRMWKFPQDTIKSAEFVSIPTYKKFTKAVRYIHDSKSWERCYVILKIIFPCFRIICLVDINIAGMEKVYYYLIMTKRCIEKTISDIDYQRLFQDISSPDNIWNDSDDESDEEESISNDYTLYSENICFVTSNLWNEREKHINTVECCDWLDVICNSSH